jgi:hypothetical protein
MTTFFKAKNSEIAVPKWDEKPFQVSLKASKFTQLLGLVFLTAAFIFLAWMSISIYQWSILFLTLTFGVLTAVAGIFLLLFVFAILEADQDYSVNELGVSIAAWRGRLFWRDIENIRYINTKQGLQICFDLYKSSPSDRSTRQWWNFNSSERKILIAILEREEQARLCAWTVQAWTIYKRTPYC